MVGIVIDLLLRLGVNSHEFWQETIKVFLFLMRPSQIILCQTPITSMVLLSITNMITTNFPCWTWNFSSRCMHFYAHGPSPRVKDLFTSFFTIEKQKGFLIVILLYYQLERSNLVIYFNLIY
jgi:hypothetical protein